MARYVRKIQFTGKSTYIVSLPKKWVLQHGLLPGSQVVVEETDSYVVIKPFKPGEGGQERIALITVSESDTPESVTRRIIGAYVMGYDKVVIKASGFITPVLRNAVREVVLNKLPGTEIIGEDRSEIQIQVLLSARKAPLVDAIKRLARVVQSVLRDACSVVESGDVKMAQEIAREDDSIDRVFFYVVRLINQVTSGNVEKEAVANGVELITYRVLSKLLERIGDHATNIAVNATELIERKDLLRSVNTLCIESLEVYGMAIEAFFEKNPLAIEEIASRARQLKRSEEQLLGSVIQILKPGELISLRMLLESIRRVAEYSKDIGELTLDISIDKVVVQQQVPVKELAK
ncbi:MAG: PhoU domain-containing protein [Desulfurococcaceae archaeon]